MNDIIISELEENTYKIKILNNQNIHNKEALKKIVKYIITKIRRKNNLKNHIFVDIYPSNFITIIILKDYDRMINIKGITEIKINIHTDTILLYEIDYFKIKEKNIKGKIYYYKNKFYLRPININEKEHLLLEEEAPITYEDSQIILDKGIKL